MPDHTREVLAIIPARGGSRGVPRKNLRPLGGKPLLAHSIGHALSAELVTRTTVSTEAAEIAEVARKWGAEVIPRPAELARDTAATDPVLLAALQHLEQREGYVPDLVVLLQPTSPLREAEMIDDAIRTLEREKADSLLSVYRSHDFHWRKSDTGAEAINYDHKDRPRRQDLEAQYTENGSIYVTRTEVLKAEATRLGGRTALYEMSPLYSVQIDSPDDLILAESLLSLLRRRRGSEALRHVRLLALDFDGVMTDNQVLVFEDGREAGSCSRGDGLGLSRLKEIGLPVVVISAETNPVVSVRCAKLGVACIQNVRDKLQALSEVAVQHGVDLLDVAFVGNDISDVECMKAAGVAIAVADAYTDVLVVADLVTETPGGKGAVREIVDLLFSVRRGT